MAISTGGVFLGLKACMPLLKARGAEAPVMTRLHPLGRLGTVDDIANAVLYLASDRASWVPGASLVVDGGRLA